MLTACETLQYGWQAYQGHRSLMREREPVQAVIDNPQTSLPVREQLQELQQARVFAVEQLQLPDNGSYQDYVALERSYVVKNVFVTPEFDLELKRWCYPVAGCVSYQGYFSETDAKRFAERFRARGNDVYVGNVSAYSTLGRFRDPIVSSMLFKRSYQSVALMFHELAHQLVYARNDTAFNESFASFVEFQGASEWLVEGGEKARVKVANDDLMRWQRVVSLYSDTEQKLADLYSTDLSASDMRQRKAEQYAALDEAIRALNADHQEHFLAPENNAQLLAYRSYEKWLPALAVLYEQGHCEWSVFHAEVKRLARMPSQRRRQHLENLQVKATPNFELVNAKICRQRND